MYKDALIKAWDIKINLYIWVFLLNGPCYVNKFGSLFLIFLLKFLSKV